MVQEQMIEQEQTVLQLPRDFLKTPTTPYQSGTWTFALPDRLTKLLQEQGSELERRSLLLAGFSALLHRYTQQETLNLGLRLASGRLGHTATVAIGVSIQGEATGRDLISQIAAIVKQAQNQPTALSDQLLDHPLQNRSTFPAIVTLSESTDPGSDQAQALTTQLRTAEDPADLHLILLQQGRQSSGILSYDANLFRPDTIQRLAGHLQVLIAGMAEDLDCPIAQLPLLTQAETEQLATWSSARVDYPEIPMHRQIEAHAVQQPDAIALTFRDQHLTYAELNQRANQLAHYLISLGVGADVTVAVCVEPCLDILIGLLGIFKAGGVYVPLDPTYPAERLATILEETQPQVFLTQSHLLPHLPAFPDSIGDRVFCCDRDSHLLQSAPTHNPAPAVDLDRTAYLVYTSGTTGKPKGVMVSHRNLINYIRVAQERFGVNQQDVIPAIARFTFSITMFELVLPLAAGGRLVILEREHILDFQRMVQTLQQVTLVHTSPSLMKKLLDYIQDNNLDSQNFQNLRHASCGGDLVPADLLETMKAVFQSAEIFVVYGCSEISCMGCAYPVSRDRHITGNRVGQPFSNVSVRLYDPHQNPVPIGVTGEIWFGGAGVTRGYLHREELTQERFVELEGDRFYRTGDLGRWDCDGNLEILGRNDFQIQLRGMRIEPGEIEATLRQAIGVREAVVMARTLENGELALVAYVVLDQAQNPTIAQLRQFLQAKLPYYMVPAIFMSLEAMPLTPNGKLDRRSLPAPANLGADSTEYVNPRTPLEVTIAAIWADVLRLESVSVADDFFALGGHSLLCIQLFARIEQSLGRALPPTLIFQAPTVKLLAALLRQSTQQSTHSAIVIQEGSSTQPPLFCIHVLGPNCQFFRPLVAHLNSAQSVYGLAAQMADRENAPPNRITDLAAYYIKEMQRIQPHGPYYLTGMSFGGCVAFEMACQLTAQDEPVALLALLDTFGPNTIDTTGGTERVSAHLDRLMKLGPIYLLKRVKAKLKRVWEKTLVTCSTLLQRAGYPLSYELKLLIVVEENKYAATNYAPTVYPGRILLFRATEGIFYSQSYLEAGLGWRKLTRDGLEIYDVPGDHMQMLEEPNVQVLAEKLQASLTQFNASNRVGHQSTD